MSTSPHRGFTTVSAQAADGAPAADAGHPEDVDCRIMGATVEKEVTHVDSQVTDYRVITE